MLGNAINNNLDEFINFCRNKNSCQQGGRLTKVLAPFLLNSLSICCLSTRPCDEMDSFESFKAVQACYTREKIAIQMHINRNDQEAALNRDKQEALDALDKYFQSLKQFKQSYPDFQEDELVFQTLSKFTIVEKRKLEPESNPILETTLHDVSKSDDDVDSDDESE